MLLPRATEDSLYDHILHSTISMSDSFPYLYVLFKIRLHGKDECLRIALRRVPLSSAKGVADVSFVLVLLRTPHRARAGTAGISTVAPTDEDTAPSTVTIAPTSAGAQNAA